MDATEKLLLSAYLANASYINNYWTVTKENFTENMSKLGIESLTNEDKKNEFINNLVHSFLPVLKSSTPKWTKINELDAVLVVDMEIDGQIKRFISLRGTEVDGFYRKLAIPMYLSTRYVNFSKSFNKFSNIVNETISEINTDTKYDEVILCGHSYGGAMVGEFFRKKEDCKYSVQISGATFGSPGTGQFLLTNYIKKFLKLGNLFGWSKRKESINENFNEFTNTSDLVPRTRFLSGNSLYGNHYSFKCENKGHSMNSVYVKHINDMYLKGCKEEDLMYGVLKKATSFYDKWVEEYNYALNNPLLNHKYGSNEEDASIRATTSILGETKIRSKPQQDINSNVFVCIKKFVNELLHKITYNKKTPENLIYNNLLESEKVESLEALEFCGFIRGMKNKRG
jgi:hypothetical protein